MKKIKVLSIFGTRADAAKMAPLIKELESRSAIQSVICVTAQHRQQLDQVLRLFAITPDYDLDLMKDRQSLSEVASRALTDIEPVLIREKPDLVLVHGDTATTFVGALAAFYQKIRVGHVEAGLRTYDKYQPYPEEVNRLLVTALADLYFAPTRQSKENLLRENVSPDKIYVTGNTAIDVLKTTVRPDHVFSLEALRHVPFENRKVIAMTAHRNENLGGPLENICRAALRIVEEHPDVELVYAMHLNPLVREPARRILGGHPRIHLTEPPDVQDMHNLMSRSYLVLTDSGGLQEEAPGFDKPVVVMRNVTERPEGLEAGTLVLAGTETDAIVNAVTKLLTDEEAYRVMASAKNPYGDGFASRKIADAILYAFGIRTERPEEYLV